MKLKALIDGPTILAPFYKNGCESFSVGAEHDQIWLFRTDTALPPDVVQKMIDAGWWQEYEGMDYDKDFTVADYRPDESWTAYT